MKRRLATLVIALGVAMGLTIPAGAVQLHEAHRLLECGATQGHFFNLHFVNNQTGGQADIYLWVQTETETIGPLLPNKMNRNVNQWDVMLEDFSGPFGSQLITAWTTIGIAGPQTPITSDGPGKLVLSDYKCKSGGGTQEP